MDSSYWWLRAQNIGGVPAISCKWLAQCGHHVQRLDDLPRLAVIEHVHDIAVAEGMGSDRN